MERTIEFVPLLSRVQEYISSRYSAALTETEKLSQLRSYIEKYLRDYNYKVEGLDTDGLTEKLHKVVDETVFAFAIRMEMSDARIKARPDDGESGFALQRGIAKIQKDIDGVMRRVAVTPFPRPEALVEDFRESAIIHLRRHDFAFA